MRIHCYILTSTTTTVNSNRIVIIFPIIRGWNYFSTTNIFKYRSLHIRLMIVLITVFNYTPSVRRNWVAYLCFFLLFDYTKPWTKAWMRTVHIQGWHHCNKINFKPIVAPTADVALRQHTLFFVQWCRNEQHDIDHLQIFSRDQMQQQRMNIWRHHHDNFTLSKFRKQKKTMTKTTRAMTSVLYFTIYAVV